MLKYTLKYRMLRKACKAFRHNKKFSVPADVLREKYREKERTIYFPDRAWSRKLEYECRVEQWGVTTMLTQKSTTKALLYIPDGRMLQFPYPKDYRLFEELALKTGRDVVIPYYPPCINCSISDAVKIVYEAYKHISVEYGTGNVAVAGCSSGGNLALALVSHINVMAEGVPMPELLYVASPEMCIRTPEERALAEQLEKSDIIQSVGTLDTYRDLITNGKEQPDYMLYPQLGIYNGMEHAYVCFADSEVLYAMCDELVSRMEDAGAEVELEVGIGMYHAYPVSRRVKDTFLGHYNMLCYLMTSRGE